MDAHLLPFCPRVRSGMVACAVWLWLAVEVTAPVLLGLAFIPGDWMSLECPDYSCLSLDIGIPTSQRTTDVYGRAIVRSFTFCEDGSPLQMLNFISPNICSMAVTIFSLQIVALALYALVVISVVRSRIVLEQANIGLMIACILSSVSVILFYLEIATSNAISIMEQELGVTTSYGFCFFSVLSGAGVLLLANIVRFCYVRCKGASMHFVNGSECKSVAHLYCRRFRGTSPCGVLLALLDCAWLPLIPIGLQVSSHAPLLPSTKPSPSYTVNIGPPRQMNAKALRRSPPGSLLSVQADQPARLPLGQPSGPPVASIDLPSLQRARVQRQRDCLRAIEASPTDACAYVALAETMASPQEVITLPDGRNTNEIALFSQAISLDPQNTQAYCSLANILTANDRVSLVLGDESAATQALLDRKQIVFEAVGRCATPAQRSLCLSTLALLIPPKEAVVLPDGRALTKQQLCLEAIALDPANAKAYCNLGVFLSDPVVELPDGRRLNKRQLYMEAIRRDPLYYIAWNNLGALAFAPGESIELPDGRTFAGPLPLLLASLAWPRAAVNAITFGNIAQKLGPYDCISLGDGGLLGKKQVIQEGLKLNPRYAVLVKLLKVCEDEEKRARAIVEAHSAGCAIL